MTRPPRVKYAPPSGNGLARGSGSELLLAAAEGRCPPPAPLPTTDDDDEEEERDLARPGQE